MLKKASELKQDCLSKKIAQELLTKQAKEASEWTKQHMMQAANKFLYQTLPSMLEKAETAYTREVIYPHESGYAGELALSFFEPGTEHCEMVQRRLAEFEYKTEIITKEVGNCEYVTTADGYDMKDAPGTHKRYQIRITW